MNAADFWQNARRRRNHFFLWAVAWPFFGVSVAIAYRALLGHEMPFVIGIALLIAWFIAWVRIQRKLTTLACPACGQHAFAHPYFFMRHAKCQHCGFAPSAAQQGVPGDVAASRRRA